MAEEFVELEITRDSDEEITGVITPGLTLSTPTDELEFEASGYPLSAPIVKTLDDDVTITSESADSIAYRVAFSPEDTADLPDRIVTLEWSLRLKEANGRQSYPVGGTLRILMPASRPTP